MASVIEAAEQRTQTYVDRIKRSRASCVTKTDVPKDIFHYTTKHVGKVRDIYSGPEKVLLISTDRQSAFDRHLASIPFKGQVLNSTSAWWFEQTKHITKNHVIAVPHPSVTVGRKCTIFPVEFVMRGYLTGSTNTSILTHYTKGARSYCGHQLPDGLKKSQKLPQNLLTPTTKDDTHDELISAEEIVASGRMSKEDWEECARISHALFSYGQEVAASRGLILVDTKYEFGKDSDGNILLVDEIHTPDSSRYWLAGTYDEKFAKGEAPDNIDKEFLRLWFKEHCDPYKDEVLPVAPESLVVELSRRYILLYELITGQLFPFPASDEVDEHTRIVESLRALSH